MITYCTVLFMSLLMGAESVVKYSKKEIDGFRKEVQEMFYHAYNGYMTYAYPYDELKPISCTGQDTWGSYSLTLIDALDTLGTMDNKTEFQRVTDLITKKANFDTDINVSVFETNIRIIGGLLGGHLMYRKMGMALPHGWPCEGPLLSLAADVANRILPAFDTPTGMPYGTVNLQYGVPEGETPVTCTAGVGTYLLEFGTLSRLTGNPLYEQVALRALFSAWQHRSSLDLLGNHIDVTTGQWTAQDSGIGAGIDSLLEYLVKGAFYLQKPELMKIFHQAREAIDKHLRHDDWYLWATMGKGHITMAVFQSLEAYWPGILSLIGDTENAQKTLYNYHQVWKQFGFTPEFYNIPQSEPSVKREGYPLRPEFVESLMYLFQATGDHSFLSMGLDVMRSIQHSAKTNCGFATIKNVNDHTLDDRMESFFLAETTKYLYLLFDPNHWLHNKGERGIVLPVNLSMSDGTTRQRTCIVEGGGVFFNTEAHPLDVGALECCQKLRFAAEDADPLASSENLVNLILNPSHPPPTLYSKRVSQAQEQIPNCSERKDPRRSESSVETGTPVPPAGSEMATENIKGITQIKNLLAFRDLLQQELTAGAKLTKDAVTSTKEQIQASSEPTSHVSLLVSGAPDSAKLERKRTFLKTAVTDTLKSLLERNKSLKEDAPSAPSVSSSKFGLGTTVSASSVQNIKDPIPQVSGKKSKYKYTIEGLKEKLKSDMKSYANMTESSSFYSLSCPTQPFYFNLNFKGQMFYSDV